MGRFRHFVRIESAVTPECRRSLKRRNPRVSRGSLIGAPRFELGTSPTRTVRATRLRHAPTRLRVFHTSRGGAYLRRCPRRLTDILARDRPAARARALRGLRPQRPAGAGSRPGADGRDAASPRTPSCSSWRRARARELLLVHHGLFWGSGCGRSTPLLKRRLKLLFDADIALAAYHLPLDAHPELGNNALLARALGADELSRSPSTTGEPIGFIAQPPRRRRPDRRARSRASARSRHASRSSSTPARPACGALAIVSGAGADYLDEAARGSARRRCSPARRPSARWRRPARRACTSSPPGTTRPRRSASGGSASTSPSASRCDTSSSTCPTPCERPAPAHRIHVARW